MTTAYCHGFDTLRPGLSLLVIVTGLDACSFNPVVMEARLDFLGPLLGVSAGVAAGVKMYQSWL